MIVSRSTSPGIACYMLIKGSMFIFSCPIELRSYFVILLKSEKDRFPLGSTVRNHVNITLYYNVCMRTSGEKVRKSDE